MSVNQDCLRILRKIRDGGSPGLTDLDYYCDDIVQAARKELDKEPNIYQKGYDVGYAIAKRKFSPVCFTQIETDEGFVWGIKVGDNVIEIPSNIAREIV